VRLRRHNVCLELLRFKRQGDKHFTIAPDQQGAQSVVPPFSGELNVDKELKLSHENFKQTVGDFFKDKHMTPLIQLTATPPYPTPDVLAQFASKAYKDYKKRETDTV